MEATLGQLCETLRKHGMSPELLGDPDQKVSRVATLEDAVAGDVSFLSNPKYEKMLGETKASAVVARKDVTAPDNMNIIQVRDPYAAITALIVALHGYRQHRRVTPDKSRTTIHETATIGENATIHPGATIAENVTIGRNAVIYPGCYVGPGCRIGDDLLLYPNVVLYDYTVVGDRVTIHANTVVGEDGLGYAPVNDQWVKIPQIGHVEIEDDVEIGAGCAVDRATLGKTVIGRGSKLSNLIAVGHGTRIGQHCLLVAQVGLAGSVNVGNHVTMAGQVGVVGHIRIGDHATLGAKAGVINNVPDHGTYLGQPAIPINEMKRRVVHISRLPEMQKKIKSIEAELSALKQHLADEAHQPASKD